MKEIMNDKEKIEYIVGLDPISNGKDNAAIVVYKYTNENCEVVKIKKFYSKWKWVQRLKFWWEVRKIARKYKGIKIIKETNDGLKNANKFTKMGYEKYLIKKRDGQ